MCSFSSNETASFLSLFEKYLCLSVTALLSQHSRLLSPLQSFHYTSPILLATRHRCKRGDLHAELRGASLPDKVPQQQPSPSPELPTPKEPQKRNSNQEPGHLRRRGQSDPGDRGNRRPRAPPRKSEGQGEPHGPKQWSFPASSGARPPPRGGRRAASSRAHDPAPGRPRPLRPTGPASLLVQGFFFFPFFFWRQISVGCFPELFEDPIGGPGVGGHQGVRAHCHAGAPPRAPGRGRKERGRRWKLPPLPPARWRPQNAGQGAPGDRCSCCGARSSARGGLLPCQGLPVIATVAHGEARPPTLRSVPPAEPPSTTPSPRTGQCLKLSTVQLTCRRKPAPW